MGVAALAATLASSSLTVNRAGQAQAQALALPARRLPRAPRRARRPAGARLPAPTDASLRRSSGSRSPPALINLLVIGLDQPAPRRPRSAIASPPSSRTPSSSALLLMVATFVFNDKLLTTSAVAPWWSASRCRTRSGTPLPGSPSRARSRSTSATGFASAISKGGSPRSPGARRSCAPSPATSSSFRTTSSARKRLPTIRSRRRRRGSRSKSAPAISTHRRT